jgi:hypothetical protein
MSHRLALANAIEDAGIPRDKAQRVASVIFDAIHDNVATKADVQAVGARIDLVEHRLLTRLGGLVVVAAGILFAALRYLPPPGHGG